MKPINIPLSEQLYFRVARAAKSQKTDLGAYIAALLGDALKLAESTNPTTLKPLNIPLSDELYSHAERHAKEQKADLGAYIVALLDNALAPNLPIDSPPNPDPVPGPAPGPRPPPLPGLRDADFHPQCIQMLNRRNGWNLQRQRSDSRWGTPDKQIGAICCVAFHVKDKENQFWFGVTPSQEQFLSDNNYREKYLVLGLGSERQILTIPFEEFDAVKDELRAPRGEKYHVHIKIENSHYTLRLREPKNVTEYLL